ncbi:MAG TPA: formate dehydrogenase, partial [Burkholderiales bacterium]|nr:formate dehydrogenase [Burkholderiales bacterium]
MSIRVYVPRDSSALSMGAEAVASAVASEAARHNADIAIVRNGSRGLYWLEPMVEVETSLGRIAYGPVTTKDVASLFEADFLHGGRHALLRGPVDEIPYLRKQERLTFARVGITDPLSLEDYAAHGGWQGLRAALAMDGASAVKQVTDSGLRGRGGAAFPAGIKWKTVLDTPSHQKYVVCNADEGDSGTYSDRMIMEGDPYVLIEGMAIAGIAVGATHGYIYVRSEYPHACQILADAITLAREQSYLGANILGSDKAFELEVRKGAGAYICGEETSLLESLEGKRGMVR